MKISLIPDAVKREIVLAIKILFMLALFFGILEFFQPQYFLWDDNASFFLPSYDLCIKSLLDEHSIPWMLWNHNLGQTFLSKVQEGFFYPPIYLMGALSRLMTGDTFWVIDLLVIVHLIFGGWGMSFYLKRFNFSDAYRLAGAFLYVTTPFGIILSKAWVVSSYAICMMPWTLIAIEKIGKERGILSCFPFIFVEAFFFLNGYVQFWFQANLMLLIYILLRSSLKDTWSFRVAIPRLIGSSLATILLIYPLILLGIRSQNDSFERATSHSLEYLSLGRARFVDYISAQIGIFSFEVFNQGNSIMYWNGMLVGLVLVILVPILKNRRMDRKIRLFFLLSFLTILLSLFLFSILYWIPPYNSFRFPFRWLLFLSVFLIPLFLFTIQNMTQNKRNLGYGILFFITLWNLSAYFHSKSWCSFSQMHVKDRKGLEVSWWNKNYRCVHVSSDWGDDYRPNYRAHLLPTLIDRISYFGCDVLLSRRNFELVSPFAYVTTHSMPTQEIEKQFVKTEKWSGRYLAAFPSPENIKAIEKLNHLSKIAEEDGIVIYENLKAVPLIYFESAPQQPVPWEIIKNRLVVYTNKKEGKIHLQFLALPHLKIRFNENIIENIPVKQDSIEWILPPGIDQIEIYYENRSLERQFKSMGLSWVAFFLFFGVVKYRQGRQKKNQSAT